MRFLLQQFLIFVAALNLGVTIDIGPDTCDQDRTLLSKWYIRHGSPNLVLPPRPLLLKKIHDNPYDDPDDPPRFVLGNFCGIQWSQRADPQTGLRFYRMMDFESEQDASIAGYSITHKGHCGACSSIQDLGVYMNRNLTAPVRRCGSLGFMSSYLEFMCLKWLGFSDECATIWQFNIINTRKLCMDICIKSWWEGEPNNKPDGSLNDCLQCDEDYSGPNFKYFAGRTRRNSGIPSSIHRPPSQIYNMTHCYWYGDLSFNTTEE